MFTSTKRNKKKFFVVLGAFFLFLAWGASGMYDLIKNLPNPDRISERNIVESTKIYDRTGKTPLYEIHGEENRTVIPLDQIPEKARFATLAAEDANFYTHSGIDLKGIVRALIKDLLSLNFSQGGSTITQQLIKNSILGSEKTIKRKIAEQILAVILEREYSKDKILELYLNQIPYGSNAYGIEAASQTYFAKPVQDLTLAESALLASLIKATTYYSPYGSHKEELFARKDLILDRMAEDGFASKTEADAAKKQKIVLAPPKQSIRAPHFVFFVREYLEEKYGKDFVERGGLKVITTLDWDLQQEAEKDVSEVAQRNESLVNADNAGLVAINPKTGEILAMVGSKDYFGDPSPKGCSPGKNCKFDPQVNVTIRPRQPGSAFKPFVYATAFKKGYTPNTVLFDVPTEFNPLCNPDGTPGLQIQDPKDCYHPKNYDDKFRGPVTLRQSIAQSLNVPSVKLLYLAGVYDSIKTAQTMGISTLTNPQQYGLSLVLGGAEVTLLEMTSSFGAFAQDGILHQKTAILRIENSRGSVLEEFRDASGPVIDTEVARTINDVLSDNNSRIPIFSPTSALYFPERRVAAKTGTTQDSRDAWTIGYTPSLVVGVWAGNNDNTPMNRSSLSIMVSAPIWHNFLESILQKTPPEDFVPEETPTPEKPALRGIYRSGPIIKIDKVSGKLASPHTPPDLIQEIGTGDVVSILALVRKEDPFGAPPTNPFNDPQYKNWQTSIEKWVAANHLFQPQIPQDTDNIHTPERQPKVSFPEIEQNPKTTSPKEIKIKITTVYPLEEISLFINDELIDSKTAPITSEINIFALKEALSPGVYKTKAVVYDSVGNKVSQENNFEVIQ